MDATGYTGPTKTLSNAHIEEWNGAVWTSSSLGLRAALALLVLSVVLVSESSARAAEDADEERPAPRAIDPGVAPGPALVYATRPSFAPDLRACSPRVPVCVHASSPRDGEAAMATLDAFERAWQTLTGALSVPPPDVDPSTLAYDVFLAASRTPELGATEVEARDVRSRVDRARSFTTIDPRVRRGCVLDTLAAREVARASLFRVAPATEEGTAIAQTTYLAELACPCAVGLSADALLAFQSQPERAFADAHAFEPAAVAGGASLDGRTGSPTSHLFAAGASAFWARLDWAYGRTPGGVVTASWALHPTMTELGAARWTNEPDTFDVLRATFKGALSTRGTVADLWLDFGVARAFVGSADDGLHLPELRTLGDAARVPYDWDIPWPTAPRRLAPRTPVFPTGASYLVIRHDGAAPGARLRVEIEWEEHALFRWAFVKLDAAGLELGRVVIPTAERATQAQMTLVDLDRVDRVMLVGVNLGDPAYAFDPDDEVWEPHGWMVTVSEVQ